jgi:hypothetical protein
MEQYLTIHEVIPLTQERRSQRSHLAQMILRHLTKIFGLAEEFG